MKAASHKAGAAVVAASLLLAAACALSAPGAQGAQPAAAASAPSTPSVAADPLVPAAEAQRLLSEGRYAEAIPLAEQALALAERTLAAGDPLRVLLMQLAANAYRLAGRADEAINLFERAVAAAERVHGAASPEAASGFNSLGAALLNRGSRGDAERALPLLERALAIREAALAAATQGVQERQGAQSGQGAPSAPSASSAPRAPVAAEAASVAAALASTLSNLAAAYDELGRPAEALPLHERAVALAERTRGADDPRTATALNNLAETLATLGRFTDALARHRGALAIRERTLGPDHPETATSLNNLGDLLETLGRTAEALPLKERAAAAHAARLGPAHPLALSSRGNLANLLAALGRHDEALALARAVLDDASGTSSAGASAAASATPSASASAPVTAAPSAAPSAASSAASASLASALHRVAYIHLVRGEYTQAQPLAERALAERQALRGADHPETAAALNNLAEVHSATGEYGRAMALHRRALAIREAAFGPQHPETAGALNNLASLHQALGQLDEAEPLLERSLAIHRAAFGEAHPETAQSLNNLGHLHAARHAQALREGATAAVRQGAGPDARPDARPHPPRGRPAALRRARMLFEQALTIIERAHGPEHPALAVTLNNLAGVLEDLKRPREALPLHERSLALRERAFGPRHPAVALSLNNLAALHDTLGEPARALPLYRRALAILQPAAGVASAQPVLLAAVHTRLARWHLRNGREAGERPDGLDGRDGRGVRSGTGSDASPPTRANRADAARHEGSESRERRASGAGRAGRAAREQGIELAIFHLKQAVNLSQALRAGTGTLDRGAQASLTRGVLERYTLLAELLVRRGRLPEAEQVLALLKDAERREFVRGDAQDAGAGAARADLTPAERELADALAANAASLTRAHAELEALAEGDAARRQQLLARIQADGEALDGLLADAAVALAGGEAAGSAAGAVGSAGSAATAGTAAGAGSRAAAAFETAVGERDAIAQRLAQLDERSGARTAALFIVPGARQTTFLLVTAQGAVGLTGGVGEARLNALVAQLRAAIEARRADYRAPAEALHRELLGPVAPILARQRTDTLMLYLTGSLRYLPVAALVEPGTGRHLVERFALAVYTVGGLRDTLAEPPKPRWAAAGLGVSRALAGFDALPSVPGELRGVVRSAADDAAAGASSVSAATAGATGAPTVAATAAAPAAADVRPGVLPGERHLDEAFTRARLAQVARRNAPFAVLHVATHFKLVPGREDESQLLLGDGDLLSLRQLRSDPTLAFGTYDLVTLSACNTSVGGGAASASSDRAGAEFEGLATTLMKKGARAVLATLWEVQDEGTARLMQAFYAARGEERKRHKAEALRAAQRAMITGELREPSGRLDFRHPYYWAGFVLMGNWL